ncbi:hypothetical protein JCM3770_004232 [Rhodotorula araucariae]
MAGQQTSQGHSHKAHGKQTNKSFKSKHATKSSLRDQAKGRTHRPSVKDPASKAAKQASQRIQAKHLKVNRKHHAKQVLDKKRQVVEDAKGIFAGKNRNGDRVQRIVAVVPMTEDVSSLEMVELFAQSIGGELTGVEGYRSLDVPKFHNQSIRFLLLPPASRTTSLFPILDAASVADFTIIALSSEEEVDAQGETVLRCLTGLGVGGSNGGVFGVVKDLPTGNPTVASSTRLSLQSFLTHFFPSIERIHCVSATPTASSTAASSSAMATEDAASASTAPSPEATLVVRALCEKTPKGLRWREARPRVLAERVGWEKDADAVEPVEGAGDEDKPNGLENEEFGTLVVEGVVRGASLNANRLVHLQGFGDFKVSKVLLAPPSRPNKRNAPAPSETMSVDGTPSTSAPFDPLSLPDDDADSLASTNIPDDDEFGLDEQTWPTEEEMASAPAAQAARDRAEMPPPARPGTTPKLKKVAKGTSAYQAAWIIDDDEEDEEQEDDDEADDAMKAEGGGGDDDEEEEEEETEFVDTAADETASVSARPFADLTPEQEEAQLREYLSQRAAQRNTQNADDLDFPDEVDTPLHVPARERFARYRGLKSFRTSRWDPYEELPRDYGRCFMLEDWKGMGRRMERRQHDGAEPGTRVIVHVANVPRRVIDEHNPLNPFALFGLFKHEHKYSIMHFTVQRNTENSDTVRSKDPLVLQQGFRRFAINPIFSQHTQRNGGRGANNVHKFERFLRHGISAHVATAYLPITFGNSPSLLLRVPTTAADAVNASPDQGIHLIGTGTLLSSDATRITAKRVILTGHPFKVHKKTATIRYLFFNRDDVEYFKPVQLRTKTGRVGHIREPLGTHGYFKAGFDGPISQLDTVCLTLYKRCFPKWGRVWDGRPLPIISKAAIAAAQEGEVDMA